MIYLKVSSFKIQLFIISLVSIVILFFVQHDTIDDFITRLCIHGYFYAMYFISLVTFISIRFCAITQVVKYPSKLTWIYILGLINIVPHCIVYTFLALTMPIYRLLLLSLLISIVFAWQCSKVLFLRFLAVNTLVLFVLILVVMAIG